jgi:hypothetical protein
MRSVRRSRPSTDLLETLYASKKTFHAIRRGLPLRVKVREVLELQRFVLPLLARRRPLRPWERPWQTEP